MSSVIGYPFPNTYYSQDVLVVTFYSHKRELIVTRVKNRFTGIVFFEYVSMDWDQAWRWHKKAIERVVEMGSLIGL